MYRRMGSVGGGGGGGDCDVLSLASHTTSSSDRNLEAATAAAAAAGVTMTPGVAASAAAAAAAAAATAAVSATATVPTAAAGGATSASAVSRPNESLYDALLRYHQEHDSSFSEESSSQHHLFGEHHYLRSSGGSLSSSFRSGGGGLRREVSCYGENDDRKLPAIPTPNVVSQKQQQQQQQIQEPLPVHAELPAHAPSSSSSSSSSPPPLKDEEEKALVGRRAATRQSSFYLAALEEANLREGGGGSDQSGTSTPNLPAAGATTMTTTSAAAAATATTAVTVAAAAVAVDKGDDNITATAAAPVTAGVYLQAPVDAAMYKPSSPKSNKPGVVMVHEPAIRSDSVMYQAAYRTRSKSGGSSGSLDSFDKALTSSSDDEEEMGPNLTSVAAALAAVVVDGKDDVHQVGQSLSRREKSVSPSWPLLGRRQPGKSNNTLVVGGGNQMPSNEPPQTFVRTDCRGGRGLKAPTAHPPSKHRSQPIYPNITTTAQLLARSVPPSPLGHEDGGRHSMFAAVMGPTRKNSREDPTSRPSIPQTTTTHPLRQQSFHGVLTQQQQQQQQLPIDDEYDIGREYTTPLASPDLSSLPQVRQPRRGCSLVSVPGSKSNVRPIVQRKMSPTRNPPTPNPMLPKSSNHGPPLRRDSSGSITPPADLMDFGSDEHIRSTQHRHQKHNKIGGAGGGTNSRPSSRATSPASPSYDRQQHQQVGPPTHNRSQSAAAAVTTVSNAPTTTSFRGSPHTRTMPPKPIPAPARQLRSSYPSVINKNKNKDILPPLTASAPWNASSSMASSSVRPLTRQQPHNSYTTGLAGGPTTLTTTRPIRNASNPSVYSGTGPRPEPFQLKRSNSSSFTSTRSLLSQESATAGRDQTSNHPKSDDSTATDEDFKLALELSRREAEARNLLGVGGGGGGTGGGVGHSSGVYGTATGGHRPLLSNDRQGSTRSMGPAHRLYHQAHAAQLEPQGSNPPPSFSYGGAVRPHHVGGEISSPRPYVHTPVSNSVQGRPTYTSPSNPQSLSQLGGPSRRVQSLVRPSTSPSLQTLPDPSRQVGIHAISPGQFGQDAYRAAKELGEEPLDDLMLALKLSAEEASAQTGVRRLDLNSLGFGVDNVASAAPAIVSAGASNNDANGSTNAISATPDEQYRLWQRMQEEQERHELEQVLRASQEDVAPQEWNRGSSGGRDSGSSRTERIQPTGPRGVLTPHPVPAQERDDFLISQQLAMEEYQRNRGANLGNRSVGPTGSDTDFRRDRLLERGTLETRAAISSGQAHTITCRGCEGRLQAPVSYSLVFCPKCQTISPA